MGILIHELGHLIGGVTNGYHLLFIEVFGITIERKKDGVSLKFVRDLPIGQCVMYHENLEKCAIPLIAGGILSNTVFGLMLVMVFFLGDGLLLVARIIVLAFGVANISLAVLNLLGSETSDGRTLKEVLYSHKQMKLYNGIMLAYSYLYYGNDYGDIPDALANRLEELLADCGNGERNTGLEKEALVLIKRRRDGFTGEGV